MSRTVFQYESYFKGCTLLLLPSQVRIDGLAGGVRANGWQAGENRLVLR